MLTTYVHTTPITNDILMDISIKYKGCSHCIDIKFTVTIKVLKDNLHRDVALLEDPNYLNYVQLFASNMAEFDDAFANAWWVRL